MNAETQENTQQGMKMSYRIFAAMICKSRDII